MGAWKMQICKAINGKALKLPEITGRNRKITENRIWMASMWRARSPAQLNDPFSRPAGVRLSFHEFQGLHPQKTRRGLSRPGMTQFWMMP